MKVLVVLYVVSFVISTIALLGDKSDNRPIAHMISIVPGLNIILTIAAGIDLVKRIAISGGRCTLGHDMVRGYSSEEVKNRARRAGVPLTCSMGGIERYHCTRCPDTQTVTWSAF